MWLKALSNTDHDDNAETRDDIMLVVSGFIHHRDNQQSNTLIVPVPPTDIFYVPRMHNVRGPVCGKLLGNLLLYL